MRPTFMAITSTGGYVGRIFWSNSGIHPDFPRWGGLHFIPDPVLHCPFGLWAGTFPVIRQIINWRFHD